MHDRNSGEAARHALLISVRGQTFTVERDSAELWVGRERPAQILIDDPGVSRNHLRITQVSEGRWVVTDASRNGTFLHGRRMDSLPIVHDDVTVHLGDPDGVAVEFRPVVSSPRDAAAETDDAGPLGDGEATTQVDVGALRAGHAVVARREELGLSQRRLADDGVVSQSVLVSFERGAHWPRPSTIAKIENYLRWPLGTLSAIRGGAAIPEDESTEMLSPTVQTAVIIDAVEIALGGMDARLADLPEAGTAGFRQGIGTLLSELHRLDRTVADTARGTDRGLELAPLLSQIRSKRAEFTLLAARAPGATLGQRLAATRYAHRLSISDAAALTGLTEQEVQSVEADQPVRAPATTLLEQLVNALQGPH